MTLWITYFIFTILIFGYQAVKMVYVEKFEACYLKPNGPFSVYHLQLNNKRGINSYITGEGELHQDLDSDKIKLVVELNRCANRESLDTCERYNSLVPRNACQFMAMKNMAWTPFVEGFVPPMKCPFKKGPIIGRNISFDPSLFVIFPIDAYYWRVKISIGYRHERIIDFCIDSAIINRL